MGVAGEAEHSGSLLGKRLLCDNIRNSVSHPPSAPPRDVFKSLTDFTSTKHYAASVWSPSRRCPGNPTAVTAGTPARRLRDGGRPFSDWSKASCLAEAKGPWPLTCSLCCECPGRGSGQRSPVPRRAQQGPDLLHLGWAGDASPLVAGRGLSPCRCPWVSAGCQPAHREQRGHQRGKMCIVNRQAGKVTSGGTIKLSVTSKWSRVMRCPQ